MNENKGITKIASIILLIVMLGVAIIGCNNESSIKEEESAGEDAIYTITDMAGRTIEVPEEINRVVALSWANRFLVYLEAADKMGGIQEGERRDPLEMPWNYAIEDQILDIPLIDRDDAESISAVHPDFMIAMQTVDEVDVQETEMLQRQTNIPVAIFRPYVSFSANKDNFDETVRTIGMILDREDRAEELIRDIDEVINDLHDRSKDIADGEKPSVYVGGKAWRGSHGIVSTSSYYSSFDFIGANNVAADLGEENAFIDKEALLQWDPEYIFLEASGFDQAMKDLQQPELQSLKAVQNENVHRILPKIWWATNYENVLINTYYIGSVIYPEQFSDIDIDQKADEIYEIFFDESVYEEMTEVHGRISPVKVN